MNQIIKFIMPLVLILGLSISCSSSDDSNPPPKPPEPQASLILTASRNSTSLIEKATFVFNVQNEKGEDLTSSSELYINNVLHTTKEFTPTEVGEYTVEAKQKDLTSNSIIVSVTPTPYFAHKVLIEDFTGAGCGWCPRVSKAIELAEAESDKVIAVAIHNPVFGPDPFTYAGRLVLENKIGVNGSYPTAFINRSLKWKVPENTNYKIPITHVRGDSPIGIKIGSSLAASSGTADISFYFKETLPNLKYVAYLVEDGLKYKQTNYTDLYGGGGVLPDFIHNNTLRATAGSILGESIAENVSVKDGSTDFKVTFASYTSADVTKLKVVIVVLDASGKAINVQIAPANKTVDFQYAR